MAKSDIIFPFFMMSQLPAGIAGLLIAAIFAATMSTISFNINSISTAFSVDFWKRFRPQTTDKQMLSVARYSCFIAGVLGMGIALLMERGKYSPCSTSSRKFSVCSPAVWAVSS